MTDLVNPLDWDSNLFLSSIGGTPGRVAAMRGLVDHSSPGAFRICASPVTVSEVAFLESERMTGAPSPAMDRGIAQLWADPVIDLIAVSLDVASDDPGMIRGSLLDGPRIKPMDAIQPATARMVGASVLLAYDRALHRHPDRYGFPVDRP